MPRVNRDYPEPVKKIVRDHYRGEDSQAKIRKILRRHYKRWADLQLWEMRLIANDYSRKAAEGKSTLTEPATITLAGPPWSWPQNQKEEPA